MRTELPRSGPRRRRQSRHARSCFYTAAVMLNDRLETVIANYAHLLEEDVAEKADRIIEERNGQGK